MMRLILATAICIFCVSYVFGQAASDIETKYGKPTKAYAVSQNIWMTPEYADNGQVCEMLLYPRRIGTDNINLSRKMPLEELQNVLKELVPVNVRGARKEQPNTATGGGVSWTTYTYEKVTFIFSFSFKVEPNALNQSKPYIFSDQKFPSTGQSTTSSQSDGDFSVNDIRTAEMVTIKWNGRKCSVH
jgi:hypothetical protein